MTEEEYNKASDLEKILYDRTGMLAENHTDIVEAMDRYADKFKILNKHFVSQRSELLAFIEEVAAWDMEYSSTYLKMKAKKIIKANCG